MPPMEIDRERDAQAALEAAQAAKQRLTEEHAKRTATKRKRSLSADEEAERAAAIRSIVLRADNRHLRCSVLPSDLAPEAQSTSDFHAKNWKSDSPPCVANALPHGALCSTSQTLEEILSQVTAADAWLSILQKAVEQPQSPKGYAMLVQILDWRYDENEIGEVRTYIEEALRRYCKMPSISVLAPQRKKDDKGAPPAQFPPHAFLVLGISVEAANALCSVYAAHISWPEHAAGISLSFLPPDLPPPTLVGVYDNVRGLPELKPELEDDISACIRDHIASRFAQVDEIIKSNKARLWGGGSISPNSMDLVLASVRILFWKGLTRDDKEELSISINFLSIFDVAWLHEKWAYALLGDELNLGKYGILARRDMAKQPLTCAICYDHDHHAKICRVFGHPAWPEEVRKRRENRIKAKLEQQQAHNAQQASSSHNYYNQQQYPPPPIQFAAHAYNGRGQGRGGRGGRGGGRGGHRGGRRGRGF